MILKFLLLICLFGICIAENRKISMFINPGCDTECKNDTNVLIHIKADGSNDSFHHIWDFTSKPTIILALTPLDTDLLINWTSFLNYEEGAIQFTQTPFYTFSFIIDKVIEFDDVNNTGVYDETRVNSSYSVAYDTNFDWKLENYVNTTDFSSVAMRTQPGNHSHHLDKGHIGVMLSAFGAVQHSKLQPHLLHTTNASQIDIQLEELPTTKNFKSRFALGLVIVSSDPANASMNQTYRKSSDDEHSPGVFTIGDVKSKLGYLEWRSVAYTSSSRMMTNSTGLHTHLVNIPHNQTFENTTIASLYGSDLENMLSKEVHISFGTPGDPLYSVNSYISWSFLGGIGAPANESLSLMVLLVVGFGIGIPAILIIIGTGYIVLKRLSRRSHDIVFAEN